ncbi:MAG: c-type cytochrome [Thermoleophilia bacterium]|nr:c-type cytochrome [Thermoleophilia bacterium]
MRFPSPFSWAFLAVAGVLCAVALGATAYWVAADESPGLSQNSVAAGTPLVPLDEDGRVRTATPAASTAAARVAPPARTGRAVFAAECAGCHTLDAAGARGTVGPDLDSLAPSVARVRAQVTAGGGGMPAFGGALSSAEIGNVAAYVARIARPPAATTTRSTPVTPPPTVTDDDDGDDDGSGRGRGRSGDDSDDDDSGKGRGGRDD